MKPLHAGFLITLSLLLAGNDVWAGRPEPSSHDPFERRRSEYDMGTKNPKPTAKPRPTPSESRKDSALETKLKKFSWPDRVTPEDLPRLAKEYAEKVGVCLDTPVNDAQKKFARCRNQNANEARAILRSGQDRALEKGCRKLKELVVDELLDGDPTYCQYGNCGEAALVNGCLAHQAGIQEIIHCSNAYHSFVLLKMPKKENYCLVDRFDLFEKGYFFCNISLLGAENNFSLRDESHPEKEILRHIEAEGNRFQSWFSRLDCRYFPGTKPPKK